MAQGVLAQRVPLPSPRRGPATESRGPCRRGMRSNMIRIRSSRSSLIFYPGSALSFAAQARDEESKASYHTYVELPARGSFDNTLGEHKDVPAPPPQTQKKQKFSLSTPSYLVPSSHHLKLATVYPEQRREHPVDSRGDHPQSDANTEYRSVTHRTPMYIYIFLLGGCPVPVPSPACAKPAARGRRVLCCHGGEHTAAAAPLAVLFL